MGKIDCSIVGKRFGRLTVIEIAEKPKEIKSRHTFWKCICDCGKNTVVASDKLKNGDTQSCGCLKIEISIKKIEEHGKPPIKHGKSKTRLYNIYNHMIARCYNPTNKKYRIYGGRGITVCNEWLNDFRAFYDWAMANGYADDLTIDRKNVNGNYEPFNCRWVTQKVQANNKRNNVFVCIGGEKMTMAQAAEKANISENTMWCRVKAGWHDEELLLPLYARRKI